MSKRQNVGWSASVSDARRCERCSLKRTRCMCAALPHVPARTRLLIVRHAIEAYKVSNTGRLAALAIEGARIYDYAVRGGPAGVPELADRVEDGSTWLLYPDGKPLAAPPASLTRLVVLDGTWRQARRMLQRIPELRGMPRLALPPPTVVRARLRRTKEAEEMSTLEAIANALAWLEGEAIARPLFELHDAFVQGSKP